MVTLLGGTKVLIISDAARWGRRLLHECLSFWSCVLPLRLSPPYPLSSRVSRLLRISSNTMTAAAAAVTLLRFSSHLRSLPSPPIPPPRLRVYTSSHRLQSSLLAPNHRPAVSSLAEAVTAPDGEEVEAEGEQQEGTAEAEPEAEARPTFVLSRLPRPKLSVKERKELASYAHGLGKRLKSQQVGKGGITPSVVAAFNDNLESNELLKEFSS
ncbi:hypothetical protein E2562_010662 [Oryza meyeriana var. granulata]|uniref:CRM domain-containing protein n=1 Tax=Oryza meyeriana var. granulata TaxID=110450 RepID=A0A6G1EVZ5_9ORYZ|nr:hypothetical protein E2562_010662 [Oryza meyeriana var. granulata]